jgi:hypothetical protein
VIWCRFFPHQDQDNYLCTHGAAHDKLLSDNLEQAWTVLHHMQERLPMALMWCRDSSEYLDKLKELKRLRLGTGESPISNSSNSTEGSNDGLLHWQSIEKKMKEFHDTKDDDLGADADHPVADLQRLLEHAKEPTSPEDIKSEKEESVRGPPSPVLPGPAGFTSVNRNSSVVSPKPMNGHTTTYASEQYPQTHQAGIHHNVRTLSNGPTIYEPTVAYYPTLPPKGHESLTQEDYNYMPTATTPLDPPYNPSADPSFYAFAAWNSDHSLTSFSTGNDTGLNDSIIQSYGPSQDYNGMYSHTSNTSLS